MTVLYGVGKARDEARHIVKKVTKETVKLFSKKNCIDVGSGDLGKNKKKKDKELGEAVINISFCVKLTTDKVKHVQINTQYIKLNIKFGTMEQKYKMLIKK
jgi:hypothetical protein